MVGSKHPKVTKIGSPYQKIDGFGWTTRNSAYGAPGSKSGVALGFKIHGAKATKWPKPDPKFGSYLAQGLKISKIHGAIAPLALP